MLIQLPEALEPSLIAYGGSRLLCFDKNDSGKLHSFDVTRSVSEALNLEASNGISVDSPTSLRQLHYVRLSRSGILYGIKANGGAAALDPTSLKLRPTYDIPKAILVRSDPKSNTLLVATSQDIQTVVLEKAGARALTSFKFKDTKSAAVNKKVAVVANNEQYILVDLVKQSLLPLFPVGPSLQPRIAAIASSEFLVVQGTSATDLAMGLIISKDGEITREGQILNWEQYPRALVAYDEYVAAIVGEWFIVHSVKGHFEEIARIKLDGAEIADETEQPKALEPAVYHPLIASLMEEEPQVSDEPVELVVCEPLPIPCSELTPLFGDSAGANTEGRILIRTGKTITVWGPPSSFLRLQQQVLDGEINEIVPGMLDTDTERGVAQLEYLSLLVGLVCIAQRKWDLALHAWLDGINLSPVYVLYLFGLLSEDQLIETFPGITAYMQTIGPQDIGNSEVFLKTYFRALLRRHSNNSEDLSPSVLEIILNIFTDLEIESQGELTFLFKFPSEVQLQQARRLEGKGDFEHSIMILEEGNYTEELVSLFSRALKTDKLYAQKLGEALVNCKNHDLVWRETAKLAEVHPEIAMQIYTAQDTLEMFTQDEIASLLRTLDNGDAWRMYLKFLVEVKQEPVYVMDLASLLVTEMLELYKNAAVISALKAEIEIYKLRNWPKRSFRSALQTPSSDDSKETAFNKFTQLRNELLDVIITGQSDNKMLLETLEKRMPLFYYERALLSFETGSYQESLKLLLIELKDIASVIELCNNGRLLEEDAKSAVETRKIIALDSAKLLFSTDDYDLELVAAFLESCNNHLSLHTLIELIPAGWKLHKFINTFDCMIAQQNAITSQHHLQSSLAKLSVRNQQRVVRSLDSDSK